MIAVKSGILLYRGRGGGGGRRILALWFYGPRGKGYRWKEEANGDATTGA